MKYINYWTLFRKSKGCLALSDSCWRTNILWVFRKPKIKAFPQTANWLLLRAILEQRASCSHCYKGINNTGKVSCYYPISLRNVDALLARLQHVIKTLVHPDQLGFIHGQQGIENLRLIEDSVALEQQFSKSYLNFESASKCWWGWGTGRVSRQHHSIVSTQGLLLISGSRTGLGKDLRGLHLPLQASPMFKITPFCIGMHFWFSH